MVYLDWWCWSHNWFSYIISLSGKIRIWFKTRKSYFSTVYFNINEPVIFGVPIVLNPILMIPFIFAPMVLATIAWFATKLGLVSEVVFTAPWTLPGPIGAFMATGGDWRLCCFEYCFNSSGHLDLLSVLCSL